MTTALVAVDPGQDPSSLVTLAGSVAGDVHLVVLAGPDGVATEVPGVASTASVAAAGLESGEAAAGVVAELAQRRSAELIVLPSTHRFREVAALLTAQLDAACAPDAIALAETPDGMTADRLLYGGVVVATVLLQRPMRVVSASVKAATEPAGEPAPVEEVSVPAPAGKTLLARREISSEGGLANAERVVAFGRGLRSQEDIDLIRGLATALGAELGCSRPIVDDAKWLDLPHQVGLTGTTVQPSLYVAVGISGQIQHLVGMRDSKFIVAINNNPSAPIFESSDVSVVGDLYEIVPRLTEAIAARSA